MEGRKENAFGVGCWLAAEYSFHIFKKHGFSVSRIGMCASTCHILNTQVSTTNAKNFHPQIRILNTKNQLASRYWSSIENLYQNVWIFNLKTSSVRTAGIDDKNRQTKTHQITNLDTNLNHKEATYMHCCQLKPN